MCLTVAQGSWTCWGGPGGRVRRPDALLLAAARRTAAAPRETLIIVRTVKVHTVVLGQQHHLLLGERVAELLELVGDGADGRLRLELGHGEVERLVGFVAGKEDVAGRLLEQHRHLLLAAAPPEALRQEVDGVVVQAVLYRFRRAVDVVVLGGG